MSTPYTFTLNRAHKIVERLKAHSNQLFKEAEELAAPLSIRSQQEVGSQARAVERATEVLEKMEKFTALLVTLRTVRQAISDANHTHGVDALLATQTMQTQTLAAYKRLLEASSYNSAVDWSQIPATADEYTRYSLETLNDTQLTQVRNTIASTQAQLHATSDKVSDVNRATITVALPAEHAAIAGLTV